MDDPTKTKSVSITANPITVDTGGRVGVAPVGGPGIRPYHRSSQVDWYDPTKHDARFIIIDLHNAGYGTIADAIAQFGEPTQEIYLPVAPGQPAVILTYRHNLLTDT